MSTAQTSRVVAYPENETPGASGVERALDALADLEQAVRDGAVTAPDVLAVADECRYAVRAAERDSTVDSEDGEALRDLYQQSVDDPRFARLALAALVEAQRQTEHAIASFTRLCELLEGDTPAPGESSAARQQLVALAWELQDDLMARACHEAGVAARLKRHALLPGDYRGRTCGDADGWTARIAALGADPGEQQEAAVAPAPVAAARSRDLTFRVYDTREPVAVSSLTRPPNHLPGPKPNPIIGGGARRDERCWT